MLFSILDASHKVVRIGRCGPEHFDLQAQDGETAVLGHLPLGAIVQDDGSCVMPEPKVFVDPTPPFVRARRATYPPIGEQLDMLWHAMDRGEIPKAVEWFERIAAVKAMHPKAAPETGFEDLA